MEFKRQGEVRRGGFTAQQIGGRRNTMHLDRLIFRVLGEVADEGRGKGEGA